MDEFTVTVERSADHVATVRFHRGKQNYFNQPLIEAIADALDELAGDNTTRAVVLESEGRHFCAGADFTGSGSPLDDASSGAQQKHLYDSAVRLFAQPLPIVAAVQGAAIGGGLGLAMAFDFRIAADDCRFAAPFARLGLHHGFGLTVTLPLVVGHQHSLDLLYTGRRIKSDEALAMGLCDSVVPVDDLRAASRRFAADIAASAPIAVRSIRHTMRGHLAEAVKIATDHEKAEQTVHKRTQDMAEGVRADLARRVPQFVGR